MYPLKYNIVSPSCQHIGDTELLSDKQLNFTSVRVNHEVESFTVEFTTEGDSTRGMCSHHTTHGGGGVTLVIGDVDGLCSLRHGVCVSLCVLVCVNQLKQ